MEKSKLEEGFFSLEEICRQGTERLSLFGQRQIQMALALENVSALLPVGEKAALLRRQDLEHALLLANRLPAREALMRAVELEHLCVDVGCAVARAEGEGPLARLADYLLVEDFDHLYRLANLLDEKRHLPAELLTGGRIEIMPGRPAAAAHLPPQDALHPPASLGPLSRARALLLYALAAEARTLYLRAEGSREERALYSELALLEEQHMTLLFSLALPDEAPSFGALSQYAEWYLYYSFSAPEEASELQPLWRKLRAAEERHLRVAAQGREEMWLDAPAPLRLRPAGEYVRQALARQADVVCVRGGYIPVRLLPESFAYYAYQRALGDPLPSHQTLARHIALCGAAYRYEQSEHPLESLQSRTRDPLCVR